MGAKVIIIGRIWQRGTKLRLHVDLLDATSGEALWGEQYDRDLTELFAIHDDIAREVSARLRVKLTGDDTTRLTKRYTRKGCTQIDGIGEGKLPYHIGLGDRREQECPFLRASALFCCSRKL